MGDMAEKKTETKVEEQKVTLSLEELQALIRQEVEKAGGPKEEAKGETVYVKAPAPERMKVKLFKDNDKYKDPLYVSVNGNRFIVPRGVEVEIPDYVAEVIERSMAQDEQTALTIEKLESKFDEKTKDLG